MPTKEPKRDILRNRRNPSIIKYSTMYMQCINLFTHHSTTHVHHTNLLKLYQCQFNSLFSCGVVIVSLHYTVINTGKCKYVAALNAFCYQHSFTGKDIKWGGEKTKKLFKCCESLACFFLLQAPVVLREDNNRGQVCAQRLA